MSLAQIRKILRLWRIVLTTFLIIGLIILINYLNDTRNQNFKRVNDKSQEYVDKRGIRVVVGHYMGDENIKLGNLSKELLNSNNFHPIPKEGEYGRPVVIPSKDLIKMQQLYQINKFNLLASDRIPLNRTLPDVRKKKCQVKYNDINNLPTTTVIIVFHNEAWSTLLRTVWSIINRSPRSLLQEILLIDDASERDFLKQPLDDYVSELPVSTRVIRSPTRIGLVKARLLGAEIAQGNVLTFLDAHCECTIGWLESLLNRIAENHKNVVCPVIDIISDDTFAYVKSFELHWGAFNWELHFRWFTLRGKELDKRKKDILEPFFTPAMAGGLFAIDRKYFFDIGAYDDELKIWGGENLELSFRIWQCGGSIEIVPCSHVGHIFRKSSPYTFPGGVNDVLYGNLARVVLVWMDDWSKFYFKFNPEAEKVRSSQNVDKRLELRKKLKCKSFKWYLNNIWPQHFFPMDNRFFGRIKNVLNGECLYRPFNKAGANQPMGIAKTDKCLKTINLLEMFVMTRDGFIMSDDSLCLDAPEKDTGTLVKVNLMACSDSNRQKWHYNKQTKEIKHAYSKLCIDLQSIKKNDDGVVIVTKCKKRKSQQWILEPVAWK